MDIYTNFVSTAVPADSQSRCISKIRIAMLVALMLTSQIGFAATVVHRGAHGLRGVDGTPQNPDGQRGQNGREGLASLSSAESTEAFFDVSAFGGNGGSGGRGLNFPPGNGGHGGNGGSAFASADMLFQTGGLIPALARARVTARGGGGGNFNIGAPDATSGGGGLGGTANAFASVITPHTMAVDVTVLSVGGEGGGSTTGRGPDGGAALIQSAYGESLGGPVTVRATAVSGTGGTGRPNSNGLNIGFGGSSPSVNLVDVVDGTSSAAINLFQTATAGEARPGGRPGDAGDARSVLSRTKFASSLNMEVRAHGGLGANDVYGHGASDGGNATTEASAVNLVGNTKVVSVARAGNGGSQAGTARFSNNPAGFGGDANASAIGEGHAGAVDVFAHAQGGSGGSTLAANLIGGVAHRPGNGGNATAFAQGRAANTGQTLKARAFADAGDSGGAGGEFEPGGALAGSAKATAIGNSAGHADIDAQAYSRHGSRSSIAIAKASGQASSGSATADAVSSWNYDRNGDNETRVVVSSNIPGSVDLSATAVHGGFSGGTQAPVSAVPGAVGASAGSRFRGNVYDSLSLFASYDSASSGVQNVQVEIFLSYFEPNGVHPFSPNDDLLLDFSSFTSSVGGFERIDFLAEYNHGSTSVAQSMTTLSDAQNFFLTPINLGPLGFPIADSGQPDLRIVFNIELAQAGQSISFAGPLPPVPLPASLWLFISALAGFLTLQRRCSVRA